MPNTEKSILNYKYIPPNTHIKATSHYIVFADRISTSPPGNDPAPVPVPTVELLPKNESILVIDDVVKVRTVMREAATVVGAFSFISLALNVSSKIIVIDPFLSILFMIGAIGFFIMSKTEG
ncbi:MAG: hypothetical protein WC464_00365 [Bdellovibrionales bacterium]